MVKNRLRSVWRYFGLSFEYMSFLSWLILISQQFFLCLRSDKLETVPLVPASKTFDLYSLCYKQGSDLQRSCGKWQTSPVFVILNSFPRMLHWSTLICTQHTCTHWTAVTGVAYTHVRAVFACACQLLALFFGIVPYMLHSHALHVLNANTVPIMCPLASWRHIYFGTDT